MKHHFLCIIEWQSGTESRWVETIENDNTPVQALLHMEACMRTRHPIQMGKLIVLPIQENNLEFVEESIPFYKPCGRGRVSKC